MVGCVRAQAAWRVQLIAGVFVRLIKSNVWLCEREARVYRAMRPLALS
jgi:hypothetical protein